MSYSDAQRLAFGTVAELYDRHRPGYPPEAIDRLVQAAGLVAGDEVLEVGAGTGKLTVPLAGRGLRVLAIEPSEPMRRVARARLAADAADAADAAVEMVATDFERFTPPRRFAAVLSAAAWHWIDPARRYRLARGALVPGGTLGLVWNFADWPRCALREPLAHAYREAAPGMEPRFSMHPDTPPARLAGDLVADARADGFTDARMIDIRWCNGFTAEEYLATLLTHQDHILLAPAVRDRLLDAVTEVIEGVGGRLELPMLCRLGLAVAP